MDKLYHNKKWLYHKYIVEELSMREIAKLCSVGSATIRYYLRKFTILARTPSQAISLAVKKGRHVSDKFKNKLYHNRNWLYQKYIIEKLPQDKVVELSGASYKAVHKYLKYFEIPIRSKSECLKLDWARKTRTYNSYKVGKNSHCWKGGRYKKGDYIILTLNRDTLEDVINPATHKNYTRQDLSLAKKMSKRKTICEHRLIAAIKLGRPLGDKEIVHHINGIKDDNRFENLELSSDSAHKRLYKELLDENNKLKQRVERLEQAIERLKS